jgi:RNA-binding protein
MKTNKTGGLSTVKGYQKRYLRGLAHGLDPVVMVGHKGLTPTVVRSIEDALNAHELIKVKFIDFKEKENKSALADRIQETTRSELVSTIGHTAVFFRPHPDSGKRKIALPQRNP